MIKTFCLLSVSAVILFGANDASADASAQNSSDQWQIQSPSAPKKGNFISQHVAEFDRASTRFASRMKEDDLVTALDCTTIATTYFDILNAKASASAQAGRDPSVGMVPLFMAKNTWSKVTDRLTAGSKVPFSEIQAKSKVLASQSSDKSEAEKTKFAQELLKECMAPITWQFAQDSAFQTYLNSSLQGVVR